MSERLRKILPTKISPEQMNFSSAEQNSQKGLVIHKTSLAQRCEVCHQSDMFDSQTGECNRCSQISISHLRQTSLNNTIQESDQILQNRNRYALIIFILLTAIGSSIYKILVWGNLFISDVLLVGLPAVLASLIVCTPKSKTFTGAIIKWLTIFILMCSIFASAFFGEQILYILVILPILYVVGSFVGALLDITIRNSNPR